MATAIFGGGCFWCTEAVFETVTGVTAVESGYAGGHVVNPTYEQVCGKRTGHAEVLKIEFDESKINYRELVLIHFATHDPTTPNAQGNDVGPQYRSAIFTLNDEQKATAESVVAELTAQKLFSAPIVTEITPFTNYYPAEAYHQGYYRANSGQSYCAYVITPKLAKFRKQFAGKLASGGE